MPEEPTFKFKKGDTVYFHSGNSPLLKGTVVDAKVIPSGCLFGLFKWDEIQYRVQVPDQGWSLWKREENLWKDIHDYERYMHS